MRCSIYLWTLLLTATVFGQTRDKRAVLGIIGGVKEISISPDEKIWLVTGNGKTYYTENIDSNWHQGNTVLRTDDLRFNKQRLERVYFFNKDTAIITGYIASDPNLGTKNGYYWTKDAGKTWELLNFGGDSWIYTTYTDQQGNAWMGGSSGDIYYSKDYGQHWKKLNSPFQLLARVHYIFMSNATTGVAGALDNEIYTTTDNWKSNKKIETPLDQKKISAPNEYANNPIEKVILWNNLIVVNQNGHIYYTETENINWKSFPIKLYDFAIDEEANTLYAISDSLNIVTFSSPFQFELVSENRLLNYPRDIKVVNNSLFVLTFNNEVYKVDISELTRAILYTTDTKIEEPALVRYGSKLIWGINENHIYIAEDDQLDWYRENKVDFYIREFTLLNDSLALFWDGEANNYLYSLKDHSAEKYFPQTPLQTFLASPIKSFKINAMSVGCYHSFEDEVIYEKTNGASFETEQFLVTRYQEAKTIAFKNKVSASKLTSILDEIDSNPSTIPLFNDFRITEIDKENYLKMVDDQILDRHKNYANGQKQGILKDFFYSVPDMLDTLDNSVLAILLNQRETSFSTTSNWFTVQMINQSNDTLNIFRSYFQESLPLNLPWKFEYRGQYFNCYNIELSRFISSCIPDDFQDKYVFNNSYLILKVAEYLWYKENEAD